MTSGWRWRARSRRRGAWPEVLTERQAAMLAAGSQACRGIWHSRKCSGLQRDGWREADSMRC